MHCEFGKQLRKVVCYGVDDRGSIPGRVTDLCLCRNYEIGYGAHRVSHLIAPHSSFPGGKANRPRT